MEFDVEKLDALTGNEKPGDYWRERAELMEAWVCELLRKNQTLRMDLEREQPRRRSPDESTRAMSSLAQYPSLSSSARPVFRAEPSKSDGEASPEPSPRKGCCEMRESVIQYAVMNDFIPDAGS
jgi:hypothetical protein